VDFAKHFVRNRTIWGCSPFMDDSSALHNKAARFSKNAASSKTARGAERSKEAGRQLEVWANELDEMARASEQKVSKSPNEAKAERLRSSPKP
jgi:hypothetical protein